MDLRRAYPLKDLSRSERWIINKLLQIYQSFKSKTNNGFSLLFKLYAITLVSKSSVAFFLVKEPITLVINCFSKRAMKRFISCSAYQSLFTQPGAFFLKLSTVIAFYSIFFCHFSSVEAGKKAGTFLIRAFGNLWPIFDSRRYCVQFENQARGLFTQDLRNFHSVIVKLNATNS